MTHKSIVDTFDTQSEQCLSRFGGNIKTHICDKLTPVLLIICIRQDLFDTLLRAAFDVEDTMWSRSKGSVWHRAQNGITHKFWIDYMVANGGRTYLHVS